jgi:subtilisin family serine protease
MKFKIWICNVFFISSLAYAQSEKPPKDWHLQDGRGALNSEKAHQELLKGKQGRKIIVAVIDSGVDIEHEDLKDVIWTNPNEIPNNGIDDDKNGYVDDIHGWNFLGNPKKENISQDTYELTREYVRLSKKYAKTKSSKKPEFAYWEQIKKDFEAKKQEFEMQMALIKPMYENALQYEKILKGALKVNEITVSDVEDFEPSTEEQNQAKEGYLGLLKLGVTTSDLKDYVEYLEKGLKYGYNPEFNPRPLVGDNPKKLKEKGYGNNDVKGPDAEHGTHVAGIIAANRENNIGIKGVASNVLIMPIRAVPDGDERDKDIANAIYYAVDNGAHIINMSFGKSYSPHKDYVDQAVQYAESKGVLLIHAAGNDAKDLEKENNFPNRFITKTKKEVSNWLEIGACGWKSKNDEFVASFSNYGKTKVHVFSPGVDIYAPVPHFNQYKYNSGTSMAAPATTGVAALIMSYFPNLTAQEVKEIILQSSTKITEKVNMPGKKGANYNLSDLCITGGVVNAYEAIKLAEKKSKEKGNSQ